MEIIRRGVSPAERKWQGNCYTCKSLLEAVESELEVEYDYHEHTSFGKAPCPVCKAEVTFYVKGDQR